jgi:hypothetical protein
MNKIKKIIGYIMFTTGASLVILAVFSALFDVEIPYVPAVLQIFAANIVINAGLFMLWKFEIRYIILQYLIDVSYIIVVLVVFGAIFDWYSVVPVWLLAAMAVVIYILGTIITITKFRKDTDEINELLQKRKEKMDSSAT